MPKNIKRPTRRIDNIEFRLEQLEIALMNLMFVVANQEKELPDFKKSIARAERLANESNDILSLITGESKAEA
jgi:ribosomal protein L29|tara:strand:+ start:427 stop:645 length:219 start_codon:yes stop_codon:yes gene_type:complete